MNKLTALCIGLILATVVPASHAQESIQNLRVVWSKDPGTQAVIVWDAPQADETARVLYDTRSHSDEQKNYLFNAPLSETGLYNESRAKKPKSAPADWTSESSPDLFYHQIQLQNLEPETIYYLTVKTARGMSREYHFKTAPEKQTPFKLIYAGDSRTHLEVARKISLQIREMIKQDDSIIALIHGGDYAVTTRRKVWKNWLEAYALTTTEDGQLLPIIPTIGNHDVPGKSPIFRQAYGYPGGERDYYTCRLTPDVSILCLNTEISAEGRQRAFLQSELEKLKKDHVKWQLAAYHKPAFPAIKQPSAAKVSWVPLFDKFNLDLVLESDGHCIKRTVPIRHGKEDPAGTVYLGEGGYGAPQRDPKPDRWYLQGENSFASKGDHIMLLEFNGDTIHYSTLLDTGETVDTATFKARR
ncbi:metallophosphoesterase family protein [Pontiella agarivorans]|uniref:Metallophosphoesterase family protein n=1 Tax=Pontiella agarivorans TaxID=3038953 RepID=A0ABU5N1E0_9BACT|nr:metallophosphoesterase family protein [Pontiella agarivorans]MDZ8120268.1 metallophosphoesterase family protein [Pontiella agarivorans]